jgi:heme oxygenase
MKPLKEATHDKHKEAERMPFNVAMFKGELKPDEYGWYLRSQLAIFSTLENNFEFPHEGLKREQVVLDDLMYLGINELTPDLATRDYTEYLRGLSQEDANAHIYLNYLAIMFGGQMMKKNTPGQGKMYDFDNMMECMQSVREIQKDEWADEVNRGFDFMIEIFRNLEKCIIKDV